MDSTVVEWCLGVHVCTCCGARPMKVLGSSKSSSCPSMGVKYGSARTRASRSLSPPSCLTTAAACWDSTRIFSWQSWVFQYTLSVKHQFIPAWKSTVLTEKPLQCNHEEAKCNYRTRFFWLINHLSVSSSLHHGHDDVFSSHEGQLMTDMPLNHLQNERKNDFKKGK